MDHILYNKYSVHILYREYSDQLTLQCILWTTDYTRHTVEQRLYNEYSGPQNVIWIHWTTCKKKTVDNRLYNTYKCHILFNEHTGHILYNVKWIQWTTVCTTNIMGHRIYKNTVNWHTLQWIQWIKDWKTIPWTTNCKKITDYHWPVKKGSRHTLYNKHSEPQTVQWTQKTTDCTMNTGTKYCTMNTVDHRMYNKYSGTKVVQLMQWTIDYTMNTVSYRLYHEHSRPQTVQ